MSEEKKQSEEKKYAQISREFVRHCGDAIGIASISTDIAVLLAEDVNYRLREAVQNAGQFMRHSKRKKLTNEDFNTALRWSDTEPVYGYSSSDPLSFVHVKEADVYCVEDNEINLVLMANGRNAFENPGLPIVRAQWLAVEGVQKPISTSATGKKTSSVVPSVSPELMTYYNQVAKAILGNCEEITKTALEDLQSNPRIAPLLPYFINFISVGVKKVTHDLSQLTKLLHTVRSLVNNAFLYLGPRPILKLLLQSVLHCIVEPSLNPIGDHWALRDYAAKLLAQIIRMWHTPINQQHEHTLVVLKDVFIDLSKPFCSHYGAVVAITGLGVESIWKFIFPNLSVYFPHLTNALAGSNLAIKADAQKVHGALLLASELLILYLHGDVLVNCYDDTETVNKSEISIKSEHGAHGGESSKDSKQKLLNQKGAYRFLYDYFGDALAARLPYFHLEHFYAPRKVPLINLFSTPELMQTGEELLEAFNVKEEEVQSTSMEDDHYSYDDNSLMSDDGETEEHTPKVDLRIKSTVSDPIQGIKLTITKLPRTQPPPVPVEPAKVTKLNIKILPEVQPEPLAPSQTTVSTVGENWKEEPFEYVAFKPRNLYIEFNFDGSMPIPSHKLRRKHPGGHPFFNVPLNHAVHKINLRMKVIGKSKSMSQKYLTTSKNYKRSFQTGNVLVII